MLIALMTTIEVTSLAWLNRMLLYAGYNPEKPFKNGFAIKMNLVAGTFSFM
jgi:hypothetical protein